MKKNRFNSKLREYVIKNITPTGYDRNLITIIYDSFKSLLNHNCVQVGSYSRFTATRPLHDLDILYILGNWDDQNHNPIEILEALYSKINDEYKNPTNYKLEISLQTHSITIAFKDNTSEVLSVDVVPAYICSKNKFDEDVYKVPEILSEKRGKSRIEYYKRLLEKQKEMAWIISDPRGYIEVAKRVNQSNNDFRKAVKIIKAWRTSCKTKDDDFKLKSFHIEQVVKKSGTSIRN